MAVERLEDAQQLLVLLVRPAAQDDDVLWHERMGAGAHRLCIVDRRDASFTQQQQCKPAARTGTGSDTRSGLRHARAQAHGVPLVLYLLNIGIRLQVVGVAEHDLDRISHKRLCQPAMAKPSHVVLRCKIAAIDRSHYAHYGQITSLRPSEERRHIIYRSQKLSDKNRRNVSRHRAAAGYSRGLAHRALKSARGRLRHLLTSLGHVAVNMSVCRCVGMCATIFRICASAARCTR